MDQSGSRVLCWSLLLIFGFCDGGNIQNLVYSFPAPSSTGENSPENFNTQPNYVNAQPNYVDPQPNYVEPQPNYSIDPLSNYPNVQPNYVDAQPNYPSAQPNYVDPQPNYPNGQSNYVDPQSNYPNAQPNYVDIQPNYNPNIPINYVDIQPKYPNTQHNYPLDTLKPHPVYHREIQNGRPRLPSKKRRNGPKRGKWGQSNGAISTLVRQHSEHHCNGFHNFVEDIEIVSLLMTTFAYAKGLTSLFLHIINQAYIFVSIFKIAGFERLVWLIEQFTHDLIPEEPAQALEWVGFFDYLITKGVSFPLGNVIIFLGAISHIVGGVALAIDWFVPFKDIFRTLILNLSGYDLEVVFAGWGCEQENTLANQFRNTMLGTLTGIF